MKRILWIVFCLTLLLSCAVSCKKEPEPETPREYVESEVQTAAEGLLLNCGEVNHILWGVGIPVSEREDAQKKGNYTEVDPDWAQMMDIYKVDDLRAFCREVYATEICEMVERTVFSAVKDSEDNVISLVRYYDSTEDGKSYLMVNTKSTVYFERDAEYLIDTLKIKEVKAEKIYLTVDVLVYSEQNQPQTRTLTFSILEEESGWRLSTPTYMTYVSEQ
jgi:hypothetical protein